MPKNPWTDRKLRVRVGTSVAVIVAGTVAGALILERRDAVAVAAAALTATVAVAGFWSFKALSRFLGRVTAAAALSLTGATILGAVAVLAPQCPDASDVGRCTGPEVATWALAGVLLPAAYLIILGVPILIGAGAAKGTRRGLARVRTAHRRPTDR